jgi:hypothetical protein
MELPSSRSTSLRSHVTLLTGQEVQLKSAVGIPGLMFILLHGRMEQLSLVAAAR